MVSKTWVEQYQMSFSNGLGEMGLGELGLGEMGGHPGWTKSNIAAVSCTSCIILNGHISETVHLIQFVYGSRVKV